MNVSIRYPGDRFEHKRWGNNRRLPVVGDTWLIQDGGSNDGDLLVVKHVTWHDKDETISDVTIFLEREP